MINSAAEMTVIAWPAPHFGWQATVEIALPGREPIMLSPAWWRPTESWARKPAERWILRSQIRQYAEACRRLKNKRQP
jgi:hypothetical protein